jgi:threonine/homoserine/homoserine lactone efflux protein
VNLAGLGIHDLALFASAALLVNLTPGPDMLFVAGTSAARGQRDGVFAALGVGLGCMLHIALAALGLSALLAASATAFTVVKWVGAAYLVWVGITMLRAGGSRDVDARTAVPASSMKVFWQGATTNALNPKVALFFLAFLPQFVDADSAHQALAFLLLGLIFVFNGTLWCLGVAAFAARAAGRIRASGRVLLWINRGLGGLFVYLGVRVAMLQAR